MTLREYVRDLGRQVDTLQSVVASMAKELAAVKQELDAALKELRDRIDALPVDKLNDLYDAEKSFQDGLNSILNYGQQHYGLNKEVKRND